MTATPRSVRGYWASDSLPARTDGADAKRQTIGWKTRVSWPENKLISGDAD